eukprot:1388361-Pyramimonas_sp.AAC.1
MQRDKSGEELTILRWSNDGSLPGSRVLASVVCDSPLSGSGWGPQGSRSFVEFFLNGQPQGRAFEGLLEGCYHPAVALYTTMTRRSKGEQKQHQRSGHDPRLSVIRVTTGSIRARRAGLLCSPARRQATRTPARVYVCRSAGIITGGMPLTSSPRPRRTVRV